MAQGKPTSKSPPYLSYKTFIGVIDGLASSGIPNRIDKSLFQNQSGAVQSQIISSLEYLNLIDSTNTPTSILEKLVKVDEDGRAEVLGDILRNQYRFIFTDTFDIEKTTTAQLEEVFRSQGIGGETIRKCITFLMQACKAAKIRVSPHITPPRKTTPSGRKPRTPTNGGGRPKRQPQPQPQPEKTNPESIEKMLLDKFPAFNPEWPDEQQQKWFDAFNQFQRRLLGDSPD